MKMSPEGHLRSSMELQLGNAFEIVFLGTSFWDCVKKCVNKCVMNHDTFELCVIKCVMIMTHFLTQKSVSSMPNHFRPRLVNEIIVRAESPAFKFTSLILVSSL